MRCSNAHAPESGIIARLRFQLLKRMVGGHLALLVHAARVVIFCVWRVITAVLALAALELVDSLILGLKEVAAPEIETDATLDIDFRTVSVLLSTRKLHVACLCFRDLSAGWSGP